MDLPPVIKGEIQLDINGRIDQDLSCLKCGYNVRGLLPNGVCPECGTPIGRSMYGDMLMYCDPVWVRTLVSGTNWIIAGIICYIVNSKLSHF